MENCKEKFNDFEPLENLKFIIKNGEIICLTPYELSQLYFKAEDSEGIDPIPEYVTINFPQFGNIKLRNFETLPLYLSEYNIFEIKSRVDEIKQMENLPEVLEDIIGEMEGNLYEIVAKEDDSSNILRQNFNLRDKVKNVLDIDNNFRKHGVDKDLYGTDDIFKNRIRLYEQKDIFYIGNIDWDSSWFVLEHRDLENGEKLWQSDWKRYIDRILPNFPYENILIAGGHICNFINRDFGPPMSGIDIDFFIYGIKDKEVANRKIEQIFEYFNQIHGIYSLNISKNCISLQLGNQLRVDIVLRLYNTKSEILHGFDLGTSAVGWDGEELLFTTLSKFTYEYQTIIVDLSRRSTTFEKRLVKYVNRTNWNLIFTDFNIDKIDDFEVIGRGENERRLYKMNYINLEIMQSQVDNEYYFTKIKSRQNFIAHNKSKSLLTQTLLKLNNKNNTDSCDYKPSSSNSHNVKCLLNDDLENIYIKITQHNDMKINGEIINDSIDMNMVKNIDEIISENYLIRHYKKIIINEKWVEDIPNYDDNDNIIKLLCVILNNQNYFSKPLDILRYIVSGKISGREVPKFLKLLVNKNIHKLKTNIEKINNIDRTELFRWNIQDPTTQLTSSINPLIKDPKDWYGKFY